MRLWDDETEGLGLLEPVYPEEEELGRSVLEHMNREWFALWISLLLVTCMAEVAIQPILLWSYG